MSFGVLDVLPQGTPEDAELLKAHEVMAGSPGAVGEGYIGHINWALDKGEDDSLFVPGKNCDAHM